MHQSHILLVWGNCVLQRYVQHMTMGNIYKYRPYKKLNKILTSDVFCSKIKYLGNGFIVSLTTDFILAQGLNMFFLKSTMQRLFCRLMDMHTHAITFTDFQNLANFGSI